MIASTNDWFAAVDADAAGAAASDFTAIEGLHYLLHYLTPHEEANLLRQIDAAPHWSDTMRRRVQHYGYRYDYRARTIDASMQAAPFPEWLSLLARQLVADGLMSQLSDQAIVNEYLPGQGIAPHVDCEPCFGPEVVSVSLGSDCEIKFTHVANRRTLALPLARGSALVLSDAARYDWTHGIPARRSDRCEGRVVPRTRRVSVTFRKVILDPIR